MTIWRTTLVALLLHTGNAMAQQPLTPSFVVAAEQRFDPWVQRLLAERSLKMLPLYGGALYYIVPIDTDPYFEHQQIQFIEALLREKQIEPASEDK